jgi:D-citramalate synthase
VDTGLDLTVFVPLANAVSAATGVPIPVNKPVLGRHAFTHESGLHVDGLLRDPSTYEPYPPERIGATRRIVLGKHSGRSCVEAVLEQHGVTATEQVVGALLRHVKDEGEQGRSVEPAALLAAVEPAGRIAR